MFLTIRAGNGRTLTNGASSQLPRLKKPPGTILPGPRRGGGEDTHRPESPGRGPPAASRGRGRGRGRGPARPRQARGPAGGAAAPGRAREQPLLRPPPPDSARLARPLASGPSSPAPLLGSTDATRDFNRAAPGQDPPEYHPKREPAFPPPVAATRPKDRDGGIRPGGGRAASSAAKGI